jgi:hypothetical protein
MPLAEYKKRLYQRLLASVEAINEPVTAYILKERGTFIQDEWAIETGLKEMVRIGMVKNVGNGFVAPNSWYGSPPTQVEQRRIAGVIYDQDKKKTRWPVNEAAKFIMDLIVVEGPLPARTITKKCNDVGFADRTSRRARQRLVSEQSLMLTKNKLYDIAGHGGPEGVAQGLSEASHQTTQV